MLCQFHCKGLEVFDKTRFARVEMVKKFHGIFRVKHLLRGIRPLKLESAIYKVYPSSLAILFIFSF